MSCASALVFVIPFQFSFRWSVNGLSEKGRRLGTSEEETIDGGLLFPPVHEQGHSALGVGGV